MVKRKRVCNPVSGKPSRTKGEFRDEVDINSIIRRMRSGISPPAWMTSKTPRYGDFSSMPTNFQDAFAIVERAHEAFESLPLEFRKAIDHDPRNLDTAPKELWERFGLLNKPEGPTGSPEPKEPKVGQRGTGDQGSPDTGPSRPFKQGSKPDPTPEPEVK